MKTCIKCGSHAFNLYAEEIDQGGLCDVHYWQGRAHRAEALAQLKQEPLAWMYQCTADNSEPVLLRHRTNWADSGSGLWIETPLYTTPPKCPWVGHMRGVRVEGDTVIIAVKGGLTFTQNEAARDLCRELIKEMEA